MKETIHYDIINDDTKTFETYIKKLTSTFQNMLFKFIILLLIMIYKYYSFHTI